MSVRIPRAAMRPARPMLIAESRVMRQRARFLKYRKDEARVSISVMMLLINKD
jgi:hypothetical protein